jgi:hypothetical protein
LNQVRRLKEAFGTKYNSLSEFALAPRIEFLLPGTPLYLGAQLVAQILSNQSSRGAEETDTLFGATALVGAHVFIADAVTLDPELGVSYVRGSAAVQNPSGKSDLDVSGFAIGLNLGLSVWL